MIPILRIAPAVCTVVALLLVPGNLRAGNPPSPLNDCGVPVQVSECSRACDLGNCNVCLLPPAARFEVNASLLFLQPASGNLVYATRVNPFPFLSPNWTDEAVRTGFTPAFNIGARYSFCCGCDVQASWTHLNTYDQASAQGNPELKVVQNATTTVQSIGNVPFVIATDATFPIQGLTPQFLVGPPPPYTSASSVAHFNYDAVNLDAGLWLGWGQHVQLRVLAGLQGAHIRQTLATFFASPDASITFFDESQASFLGVGPRLGMDLRCVAGKFDFLGGLGAATLIGTRESRLNFFTRSPGTGQIPNYQFFATPSSTQVVPGLDARLAAGYTLPMGKFGSLNCALGYQAAVYFSAINQVTLTEVENPATAQNEGTAAVFVRSAVESASNFVVHGPFLRFTLQF